MPTMFNSVSRDELLRHLKAITKMVRLSGTSEESSAFDYAESHLRSLGFVVERYASEALIGYPMRAGLELLNSEPIKISANGYSLSPSTGPEGVTSELLYVHAGMPSDYAGIDANGKIVISDGLATPAKTLAAGQAGAIGQIHINDEYIHEMCISPIWGTPVPETAHLLPSVPSVGIVRSDGDLLLHALPSGTVTLRLVTEPYRAWVPIPTLTAELPGNSEEDFVLFSGHIDSWHFGVMDNGTANATQLEVARLLAERRRDLHRGVRIAFWSGHSHGRYASSTWYADNFWQDIHQRCVCHVNIDSVGAVGATVLEEAPTMAETYDFGKQVLHDSTGTELSYRRMSRSSDQSFWGHGVPSLFASLSEQVPDDSATGAAVAQLLGGGTKSGGLGWWWHTTEDTEDKIDPAILVVDAGIYAEAMWRLCTQPRLPFDPAAEALEMAQSIAKYDAAAGSAIDLSQTVLLAEEVAGMVRSSIAERQEIERANRMTKHVNRALIPVNYTRLGSFEHDLALGTRSVPGLSDAGELAKLDPTSDAFHFLKTKIRRERNRVDHALRTAATVARA